VDELQERWLQRLNEFSLGESILGATGSRLLSGNRARTMALEGELAKFYQGEAALLFNSGYSLNSGIFAALAAQGDAIILDEYAHASLKNGAKLASAANYFFRHNDCGHLRRKLERLRGQENTGQIFVVVESVYSMDGDCAPLAEICAIAEEFAAAVVVDESHGLGTMGEDGKGLVLARGLADKICARVYGFGKAMGMQGAALVGSALLREYMINFCHSFIYTTALPAFQVVAIAEAHKELACAGNSLRTLRKNIALMNQGLRLEDHLSPIYSMRFATVEKLHKVREALQAEGIAVFAILSPTVRRGQERLRVNVHSFNSEEEIARLLRVVRK
jgi:8-amino-7-oxononanoate synthase